MEKEYLLIVSSGDWGDEFALEGFALTDRETWEHIKEGIPDGDFEAYFGSNEFVTFDDKEDYLSHLEEKPITLEKANELCDLLGAIKLSDTWKFVTYGLFVINSENY